MTKKITDLLGKKIIICDGAMGTMLQKYGLIAGELPELLSYSHPEIIKDIYTKYFQAGSDFVSSNTFGCNRLKMEKAGYTAPQAAAQAVRLAREAAEEYMAQSDENKGSFEKFVALDLGPIGKLMEPSGDLSFEEAYDIFKEVIVAGAEAGADFVFFETFMDIHEMKAAVLAAKENCDLPVFCSVTFEKNGRMLMGTDPLTAVNILQDMGIDALGINCSLGPKEMVGLAKEFLKYSRLPVLVQPNAGLPVLVNGETTYNVDIAEYVASMQEMLKAGVAIAGGCCGTTPEYIAALTDSIKTTDYPALSPDVNKIRQEKAMTAASSSTKTVVFGGEIRRIGDRITPIDNETIREALRKNDLSQIRKEAISQARAGADVLNVNVSMTEINQTEMAIEVIKKISYLNVPLQIDSADAAVIENAARYYNGKIIINSVNGNPESMATVFPVAKKYGSCVIALTQDENGLPLSMDERHKIADRIIQTAETYGIDRERILVDFMNLTERLAY